MSQIATSQFRPIAGAPFGAEADIDLTRALTPDEQADFLGAMRRFKLLCFRKQSLSRDDQSRVLGYLGRLLPVADDVAEIALDGTLGQSALAYHSDFAFLSHPIEFLALHALDVEDGQTATRFVSGIKAASKLPAELRTQAAQLRALHIMAPVQSRRAIPNPIPPVLPNFERDVLIDHPITGEPILYLTEMQTARLCGLPANQSDALLNQLLAYIYTPQNTFEHRWNRGDLVIWDNLALQHGRDALAGVARRRLQRAAVALYSFSELCPNMTTSDPRVRQLGGGVDLADVFHLPVEDAREAAGVHGAEFKDTYLEGEVFAGRVSQGAQLSDFNMSETRAFP